MEFRWVITTDGEKILQYRQSPISLHQGYSSVWMTVPTVTAEEVNYDVVMSAGFGDDIARF